MTATIDLRAAYHAIDALLLEHGRSDPYCVQVEAWNHRDERGPQIAVAVSVVIAPYPHEVIQEQAPTFALALDGLRAQLAERFPITPIAVVLP